MGERDGKGETEGDACRRVSVGGEGEGRKGEGEGEGGVDICDGLVEGLEGFKDGR